MGMVQEVDCRSGKTVLRKRTLDEEAEIQNYLRAEVIRYNAEAQIIQEREAAIARLKADPALKDVLALLGINQ